MMETATGPVRRPAIAGTFDPAEEARLRADVRAMLEAAAPLSAGPAPKALVAPHAGYIYSGPVAARAYARLAPLRGQVSRIVLLGPVHRVPVQGIALPGSTAFDTPLGRVPVDAAALQALRELPWITESAQAHALEHSLEVHLPFLQEVLGDFSLVPLAVGAASPEQVAQTLERLWGGPETRIVISSDLSHYLPYATATRTDRQTVQDMLALDAHIDHHHACGATPVNGLLLLARRRGLVPELLDLRNSGDTAGDRSRVVGYASMAFHENTGGTAAVTPDAAATQADDGARGRVLLGLARAAIGRQLGLDMTSRADAAFLAEPGATFVTLRREGALRGCMGSLQAHRALGEDVRHNARSAAFLDPRFRPLSLREFEVVEVEVSLLSVPEPMEFSDEADALAQLEPGVDGLILQYGVHRATFLPQVWDELSDPRVFMAHLKRKAGLAVDFWSTEVRLQRYGVQKWTEADPRP
jgi:hypothetical protein